MPRVGILGLGVHLPPEVRTNAWWPPELVASWMTARGAPPALPPDASEGTRRVAAAMVEQARDPFQGTVERRVLATDASVFDMEESAARMAIERSGVDARTIDLLLTYTVVPDVQISNPACTLHRRLDLAPQCFTMHTDAAAYSFMMQLALADAMIASGRAKIALLVQSCAATRLIDRDDPGSVLVGDGAAAVVVGAVSDRRGILGSVHFTDGRFGNSLVMSVPGGTWFDEGRARMHVADREQMRSVFLDTADVCSGGVHAVLAKIGRTVSDIDFLCVYQGTPWLRQIVHEHLGAGAVRSVETFTRYGYLSAAMIPINLWAAATEGQLREDDLVVLTGGGTGITYGATALRWGR